nr:uncharacterized protein LOC106630491 [Zonotrichia albicollis]
MVPLEPQVTVVATLGELLDTVPREDEEMLMLLESPRCLYSELAALKGTNEASPDVPEGLVAKVANARLAKDHLLGAFEDFLDYYSTGGPTSPSACGEADRCQRAIEDIPRLLRPPECPRSVPKISPVSMELQEVSPQQLQALMAVVATLGKVAAAVTWPHWGNSPDLHEDLRRFTQSLHATLNLSDITSLAHPGDVTCLGHPGDVTSLGHPGVPSLVVS